MGSGIDAVTIFILPPSIEVLKERLIKRGTDSIETINLRLKNAYNEIKEVHNFQYLVINDELKEAVQAVEGIIKSEEKKVKRFKNILETFYGGDSAQLYS
jgi:guanylate kinase